MYGSILSDATVSDELQSMTTKERIQFIFMFVAASMYGCWLRISLAEASNNVKWGPQIFVVESHMSPSPYQLSNFFGSLLLGFLENTDRNDILKHAVMGAAFAGSLTTFSSWIHESSSILASGDGGFSMVYRWLDVQVSGIAVPLLGYALGYFHRDMRLPATKLPDELLVGCSIFLIVMAVIFAKQNLLALLFAVVGAAIRWKFSEMFRKREQNFPIGTFAVNILSCTIFALSRTFIKDFNKHGAITAGFCGALSTMSSFAKEVYSLERADAYTYLGSSILMSQTIMVAVYIIAKHAN